jgi:hypothetical protein
VGTGRATEAQQLGIGAVAGLSGTSHCCGIGVSQATGVCAAGNSACGAGYWASA